MHFDLDLPTRIVFGAGTLDRLGPLTRELGERPLLVTGRSAGRKYGYLERALASLGGAVHFDGVSPNPTCVEVEQAAEVARKHGCDVVVGLGGGSPLDAAKAVAAVLGTGRPATELIGSTLSPADPVVPIVAVPTTAGSGSEVTKGAIVTDTVRRFRSGIRGDALTPRIAVIDPELTATVPRHVRTETAFDAFAHAVEGFVARRSDPLSQALAVQALELITEHTDDDSRAGREALSLAALLGGINVARASTCLPHRLQQAMGALPDLGISHGRGLAVVYPAWLRHTEHHAPDDFGRLARLLGTSSVGEAVGAFLERTSLASRLRDHGVSRGDLGALLDGVTGNLDNDPRPDVDAEYLRMLYEESY
ncbi:iron-containing alcohol dehydrogenase [Streptomyces acidiscabies]|uniref:Iron-containing alcohol dehydrogenase n=1 Tax=Streptomyces acidiscabies TaxID=42234 RepID=A0AAP6BDK9_9ACTN|nr:iron-containing alcohol dehydrogenase [Streptomyces acidiscabies]MBZ3917618.1 iron-containing alcohol dehydrogenase [Streptomyces acidiscabies]MDX2962695.1 iron-containing alcohol dehydrogenase [Streptomyces acidiscabies]MDX3018998.1 iron-containing alcohol dehydrogenase [Streptomyces acidiscabies]MDX3790330.1 iron-containing alcohol dehydrogenase [Streptomyces acidiscabies]GAV43009.1 NAD-dependent methanol dehydrogenase [Streptomyces acidiscabies]